MPFLFDDYAQFLESIPDAALVVDRSGLITLANSQVEKLFGYRPGELKNQSVQCLLPDTKRALHVRHLKEYFASPSTRPMGSGMELSAHRIDGSDFPVDIMLKSLEIDGALNALCVIRDTTERKLMEEALKKALAREEELARTDYLTGAANARHFYELVQAEINRFSRHKHPFIIAYVDLDNFKTVNDLFGHKTGDKVLCAVVQHVNGRLRKTDCFARLGGDEFAFLMTETDAEGLRETIPAIHRGLLLEMQRNHWPVTFSIGVITCMGVPQKVDELITLADKLMYSIKNNGKNAIGYAVYVAQSLPQEKKAT
jgi:diguanylate cyclase (GGDEF)-like protein/PAS domain S-box-containing protein